VKLRLIEVIVLEYEIALFFENFSTDFAENLEWSEILLKTDIHTRSSPAYPIAIVERAEQFRSHLHSLPAPRNTLQYCWKIAEKSQKNPIFNVEFLNTETSYGDHPVPIEKSKKSGLFSTLLNNHCSEVRQTLQLHSYYPTKPLSTIFNTPQPLDQNSTF